jgi:signal transduction histidine kinase
VTESRPIRLPVVAPDLAAPPRFVERRLTSRRAEDRIVHQETRLLAGALDELAADRSAEARLAGILALLARVVGARRAAVLADGLERRVAVSINDSEDDSAAQALAAWLDAMAPRSRSDRAAAPAAAISMASQGLIEVHGARISDPVPDALGTYALIALPGTAGTVLGFDFPTAAAAAELHDRLPTAMARHAAVILSLAAKELGHERELAMLRARDAERTHFVSTVAHELRTPLTGLSGYLDLILGGKVDDAEVEHEFIGRSRVIVDAMAELVGDLLELSQLESGTLGLELRPVSVEDIATPVVHRLDPIAMERGILLTTDLPPRLRTATGDRRRMEQILTNLAGNAVKFSAAGGVVELAGFFDGPVALIAVRDEGSGILAGERDLIFDRFYRMADHDRTPGTGLGLPIARELARAMGGDLDVASVPGSGSSFILALPGPTSVDRDVLEVALVRAIATEEIRLEERAVVRAIRASEWEPRSVPTPLSGRRPGSGPILVPDDDRVDAADDDAGDAAPGAGVGPRSAGARVVRLHAIDGSAPRSDTPAPA